MWLLKILGDGSPSNSSFSRGYVQELSTQWRLLLKVFLAGASPLPVIRRRM
jgi:hypothetical protein